MTVMLLSFQNARAWGLFALKMLRSGARVDLVTEYASSVARVVASELGRRAESEALATRWFFVPIT